MDGYQATEVRSLTMPLHRRGPSLTITLCVLRSEARLLILWFINNKAINDTPDIFKTDLKPLDFNKLSMACMYTCPDTV